MEQEAFRLAAVNERIAKSAALACRKQTPTLIAVSKGRTLREIEPLIAAGQRHFGENRLQEALRKWPAIIERHPGIRLHFIGQLQSNKAKEAIALFDCIHSVDRRSLIDALAEAAAQQGVGRKLFMQVNLADEAQKGGCLPSNLDALITDAKASGLAIDGLMCIPPAALEPAPWFAMLASLARDRGLHDLSMGMSQDFETATMLGSTHLRIGTALFQSNDHAS